MFYKFLTAESRIHPHYQHHIDIVDKVRELRELITVTGSEALIEVDGGVNLDTGSRLVDAGADALVAGNAVFSAPDPTVAGKDTVASCLLSINITDFSKHGLLL